MRINVAYCKGELRFVFLVTLLASTWRTKAAKKSEFEHLMTCIAHTRVNFKSDVQIKYAEFSPPSISKTVYLYC